MDKCIQFNKLSAEERKTLLKMAVRTRAFWVLLKAAEASEQNEFAWFLDQTAEHLNHMNTISGGKYGEFEFTELDV